MTAGRRQVLHVTPWYPVPESPAAGVFVREHALAAARFDDVAVVHLAGAREAQLRPIELEMLEQEELATVRAHVRALPRTGILVQAAAISRAVRALRSTGFHPDLVHAHIALGAIPAALYCRFAGLPLVVTEHWSVHLDADPANLSARAAACARWALGRAERLLPVGAALEGALRRLAPAGRYEVVPNVVDCQLFRPARRARGDGSRTLIAVGLFSAEKSYPTMLRALRLLVDEGVAVRLQIAGYGPAKVELEALIDLLGLTEHVELLGYVPKPELARRLRRADVFVHASEYETFGAAVAEALASGLPVVCTRCGGPEDFVTEDVGVLVEPRNPGALAAAIRDVLGRLEMFDPEQIAGRARRRFSAEVVGAQLHEIYRQASAPRRRRTGQLIATRPKELEYYEGVLVHADEGVHALCESVVRRYVSPGARVLDLGAGAGAFSLRLVRGGYQVTAVDVDPVKWRVPEVQFVQADATTPLADVLRGNVFDAVCCLEVIEHVENQAGLLRQACAVCRPGGHLILTTPNTTSFLSRAIFLRTGRFHQFDDADLSYGHISPITHWELAVLAERTGWSVVERQPAGKLALLDVSPGVWRSIRLNLLRLLAWAIADGDVDGWCSLFVLQRSAVSDQDPAGD